MRQPRPRHVGAALVTERGRFVILAPDGRPDDPVVILQADSFPEAGEKAFPYIMRLLPIWPGNKPVKTRDGDVNDDAAFVAAAITWTGTGFILARCPAGAEGKRHGEVLEALPKDQLRWAYKAMNKMLEEQRRGKES